MYTRLKDLREDKDKTQIEISKELNMQPTVYRRYEKGERVLPIDTAILISKYYGVSLDYIAGLTNDKGGLHKTAGDLSGYFELNEENKKFIQESIDLLLEKQYRSKENKSNYIIPKAQ